MYRLVLLTLCSAVMASAGCRTRAARTTSAAPSLEHRTHDVAGIGVRLRVEGGRVVIAEVIATSSAFRAGWKAGQAIAEVDGAAITGRSLKDAVDRIRGRAGTKVSLRLEGAESPLELERGVHRFAHAEGEVGRIEYLEPKLQGRCADSYWLSCSCGEGCDQDYCERECAFLGESGGRCAHSCGACYCSACA